MTGLLVLRKHPNPFALTRCLGWIAALVCLVSMFGTYINPVQYGDITYPAGGEIGKSLAQIALNYFGRWGTPILAFTAAACSFMLITRIGLYELFKPAGERLGGTLLSTLRKRREEPNQKPIVIPVEAPQPTIEIKHRNIEEFDEPLVELDPAPEEDQYDAFDEESSIAPVKILPDIEKKSLVDYSPPPAHIFKTSDALGPLSNLQKREFEARAKLLTETFEDFGISGKVVAIQPGPVVTVFEFQPDAGTKISKITGLVDDLALALRVDSIIMHPVRGKRAIGIQVPNSERETVRFGDLITSEDYRQAVSPLTLALGKSISGDPVCADLTKMPHLLMAGATGAGKSVAINALLCSIIMKSSPKQVRMILVDPKMLELSVYEGIPHLLMPVITEPSKAALALKWATQEMERRYKLMQHAKVRNLANFNEFWSSSSAVEKQALRDLLCDDELDELPIILLVIDELADLMLTAPKEVESLIQRLAQKARASGIHLVLATQRPSVDVITGVIKANLPCRAAFQVVSKHDSRTIIDQNGADKLLGNGDMLLQRPGIARLDRIQGAFISDDEVISMVNAIKESGNTNYDDRVIGWIEDEAEKLAGDDGQSLGSGDIDDPKFDMAVQIAASSGSVSASFLQRQLKIGYNRAARIVEAMEAQGMVAQADGSKPRRWLGPRSE